MADGLASMAGPDRPGPADAGTPPPLRTFVWRPPTGDDGASSDPATNLAALGESLLADLPVAFLDAFDDPAGPAFAAAMRDGRYRAAFDVGYHAGLSAGFRAEFEQLFAQVDVALRFLWSFLRDDPGVLTAAAVSVYLQPVDTTPDPRVRRAFEAAEWYRQLQSLRPLFERLDGLLRTGGLSLLALELVRMVAAAVRGWVHDFYGLTGQPRAQGEKLGTLAGHLVGMVATDVAQRVAVRAIEEVGPRIAEAVRQVVEPEGRPRERPAGLDELMADVRADRREKAPLAVEKVEGPVGDLLERLKDRWRGVPALASLSDEDWLRLIAKAREQKFVADPGQIGAVKGLLQELLYVHTDDFRALVDDAKRAIALDPDWGPDVFFDPLVVGAAANETGADVALTDGVLYAKARNPKAAQKVKILHGFESKGPGNRGELVRWKSERPPEGGPRVRQETGQLSQDLDRFTGSPSTIGGVTYRPEEVVVDRRTSTEWVIVLAKDDALTPNQRYDLGFGNPKLRPGTQPRHAPQGFRFRVMSVDLTVVQLQRVAEDVLRAGLALVGTP